MKRIRILRGLCRPVRVPVGRGPDRARGRDVAVEIGKHNTELLPTGKEADGLSATLCS
jgi:hypothetical protein